MDDATCYGLVNPAELTAPCEPRDMKPNMNMAAAAETYASLHEFINSQEDVRFEWEGRSTPITLGGNMSFPKPPPGKTAAEYRKLFPLEPLFRSWEASRSDGMRDADGLELVRAMAVADPSWDWYSQMKSPWEEELARRLFSGLYVRTGFLGPIFQWLVAYSPPEDSGATVDFILDCLETSYALVPAEGREDAAPLEDPIGKRDHWRYEEHPLQSWMRVARDAKSFLWQGWTKAQHERYWRLLLFRDQPAPGVPHCRPRAEDVLDACENGAANEADLITFFVGPRGEAHDAYDSFRDTVTANAEHIEALKKRFPHTVPVLERLRDSLIPLVEKGEVREPRLIAAVHTWRRTYNPDEDRLALLVDAMKRLDTKPIHKELKKDYSRSIPPELEPYADWMPYAAPAEDCSIEEFCTAVKQAGISDDLLWVVGQKNHSLLSHVETALGLDGFCDAVAFCSAHMLSFKHGTDREDRRLKPAILRHTDIPPALRARGAFDLRWFAEARETLGAERFDDLVKNAHNICYEETSRLKYCVKAARGGHTKEKVLQSMLKSRNQAAVVALGLLPLPTAAKARKAEILERMKVLREFMATQKDRKMGPERRRNEGIAYETGIYNLARHAGYDNATQIEWLLEIEEGAELAKGFKPVTAGETTVELVVSEADGVALVVTKKDKQLKNVPAKLKKTPAVKALVEKHKELSTKVRRFRLTLEDAMLRARKFGGADLQDLHRHPLLAPLLGRILFAGPSAAGYLVKGGKALETLGGKLEPVGKKDLLRIAHPAELAAAGTLRDWQRQCFVRERIEPFKQLFRELYVVTDKEKDGSQSSRYSGMTVKGRQGSAIFGNRGWTVVDGAYQKAFADMGVTTYVALESPTHTPFYEESVELRDVYFNGSGEGQGKITAGSVPPHLFSEIMRDIDLVVSVAHTEDAVPETSEPTIRVRAVLIEEACTALGLENVRIKDNKAEIKGTRATYTVHLGSGVVHMKPSRQISVAKLKKPRDLALPFAGEDTATEEVVAKVLLFAEDGKIKDKGILKQIQ